MEEKFITELLGKKIVQKILNIIKNKKYKADEIEETDEKKILTKEEREKIKILNSDGNGYKYLSDNGVYSDIKVDLGNLEETEIYKKYTKEEKEKLSKIIINGDGKNILTDNGSYIPLLDTNVIDDTEAGKNKTYSSSFVKEKLDGKAPFNHTHNEFESIHEHQNKNVLDDITLDNFSKWNKLVELINPEIKGNGTKVLYDDLTFKTFDEKGISSWGEIEGKPFEKISPNLNIKENELKEKFLDLKHPIEICTQEKYLQKRKNLELDANTIYIVTDTSGTGSGSGTSIIITSGNGSKYLSDNGEYKNIIDDNLSSSKNQTYSIDKVKDVIDDRITNFIASMNNSSIKIWEVTKTKIKKNDMFNVFNTEDNVLTTKPVIVQAYKYKEGEKNILEILNSFNDSEANDFLYDKETINFNTNTGCSTNRGIKMNTKLNQMGFYETSIITKETFIELIGMEVE